MTTTFSSMFKLFLPIQLVAKLKTHLQFSKMKFYPIVSLIPSPLPVCYNAVHVCQPWNCWMKSFREGQISRWDKMRSRSLKAFIEKFACQHFKFMLNFQVHLQFLRNQLSDEEACSGSNLDRELRMSHVMIQSPDHQLYTVLQTQKVSQT